AWTNLIDIDELGRKESENWVWHGCSTFPPDHRRGLVVLSRGGADATVIREFDLDSRSVVADGFALPEAKGPAAWADADTLYVVRPHGEGHATASGYARTVRRWRRGTPFAEAEIVFEGRTSDVFALVGVARERGCDARSSGVKCRFLRRSVFY